MDAKRRNGPIYMLAASVCWSFGGLFLKFIPWHAMSIVSLRAVFAALVFVIFRRSAAIRFTKGNVLTALCLSATTMLFVYANKMTTAAAAILLQFTAPIFIIVLQFILFKTKPRAREITAVALTVFGMMMFFADQLDQGSVLGNIFAIGSGLAFAGVFIGNKLEDTDPEQALFLGFLINAAAGAPFVFSGINADPLAWGSIVFLGIIQVGLAYVFFSVGIKRTPALLASLITALEPTLNPVWVALFAGETPGPFAIAGGAVIIITVVGYNILETRRE